MLIIRLLPLGAQVVIYFILGGFSVLAAGLTAMDGWLLPGVIVFAGALGLIAYAFHLLGEYRRQDPMDSMETPLF